MTVLILAFGYHLILIMLPSLTPDISMLTVTNTQAAGSAILSRYGPAIITISNSFNYREEHDSRVSLTSTF